MSNAVENEDAALPVGLPPARWESASRLTKAYWLARLALARSSGASRPLRQLVAGADDATWYWLVSHAPRRFAVARALLPMAPDEATQTRFVGTSGDAAFRQAFTGYSLFKEMAAKYGRPLAPDSKVLDFGCGWGRIIRFFLREVDDANLVGADCMPAAIELCRQTNRRCRFELTPALPPTDLPASSFDLIYLYSVFSHLSEAAHQRWLTEFHRLLKPGGILVATTRARDFIEQCERYRRGQDGGYEAMKSAFLDQGDWLARYDRGEFCYEGTGGGDNLEGNFYGEACIPAQYVRTRWSDRFEFREFVPREQSRLDQHAIVVQKG
jgi:SAM-dependent methyltransferase